MLISKPVTSSQISSEFQAHISTLDYTSPLNILQVP